MGENQLAPTPPGLRKAGLDIYLRVLGDLVAAGVTDALNLGRLADLAYFTDRLTTARANVRRHGLMVTGSRGSLVVNPACYVERDASARVESLRRALREEISAAGMPTDDIVDR